ncbi:protein sel-1 homolog 2, partial [Elgaria multicarinata webbii]|uniref:protein sel-1 homolog 2 n=1 Tax=Elgaria multicarinata webbii TaxID=159646 RepID=UPI002FCD0079
QDSFSSQAEEETAEKEDKGHHFYKRNLKILKHSKIKKGKEKAHQQLLKAEELESQKALEKLAADMLFGYNGPQAASLYEILAEEGSHKGQAIAKKQKLDFCFYLVLQALGFLSSHGIGMERNQAKAFVYYTFASIGGNLMSQMIMGYRYWLGINVSRNCEAALINYRNVASFIANKLEKNEDMPVEKVRLMERPENLSFNTEFLDWDLYQYYRFLAERGDTQIQVRDIPLCLIITVKNIDIHLARRWYDMAAETNPDAFIPVFLAYIRLEAMHMLTDLQLLNLTGNWKLSALNTMLKLHWDLFVIILIVVILILLINSRQN